jgi:hypothetical protein
MDKESLVANDIAAERVIDSALSQARVPVTAIDFDSVA